MNDLDLFGRLGVALAIGLLLGLERGWHERDQPEGGRIAGLRTFALAGLLGGVSGWLASLTGAVVLANAERRPNLAVQPHLAAARNRPFIPTAAFRVLQAVPARSPIALVN